MSSYLSSVKADLQKLVSALREELAGTESEEEREEVYREWTNELWRLIESQLKQSYINGKSSKKDGNGEAPKKKRFSDWKSRKEGE